MNFHSDPSKKDFLLPLKRDAAMWCWIPGVDSKEIVQAMLEAKYVNERAAAKGLAEEAWANRTTVGSLIHVTGVTKRLTNIDELNSRYAQLTCANQPRVTIKRDGFETLSDKDLEKDLGGEVVYGGVSKKDVPIFIDASKAWAESYDKSVYTSLAFTNKPLPNTTCNLFPGFGVKPQAGSHDLILKHLLTVICSNDVDAYTSLLDLLAWQIQHIGEPSRIIVALKSKGHQTGKSIFLTQVLGRIYGQAGFITSDIDKIIGRFNSSLRGKAYVCLEEALFSKSKKDSDAMKSLVTNNEMLIEAKFQDPLMTPVALNFFLSTNHDTCAHIEEHDKRYWILNVSEHRVGDTAYFNDLIDEIRSGGVESFFDMLLARDVSSFLPWRDINIVNDAKLLMIEDSLSPCSAYVWLKESASTLTWLGSKASDSPWHVDYRDGIEIEFGLLNTWYQKWATTTKGSYHTADNSTKLGRLLTLAGLDSARTSDARRRYIIPAGQVLENLRYAFESKQVS